jgi:glycosyltransferase involved in cell wall biosynthesis
MKVLHLSSHDHGGAGKAALRLHHSMCSEGIDSRMAVLSHRAAASEIIEIVSRCHPLRLYRTGCKVYLKWRADSDFGYQFQNMSLVPQPKKVCELIGFNPDVIIAHNLSHFISPRDLVALYKETGAPVVLNLLDMAMLTGGCHYSWHCRRYEETCGKCPGLKSNKEDDYSRQIRQKKSELFSTLQGAIVAPTSLLQEQARKSSIFRHWNIEKVMLGVDPDVFKPIPRREARLQLGLPSDAKIIFFGAQSVTQKRKGIVYLIEALNILLEQGCFADRSLIAVSAGNDKWLTKVIDKRLPLHNLGFLHNDGRLSLAYNAADVFVCPSIEDSGPMMINESMMCGTPVVAFLMGVAPDLIINGETGYLASLEDSSDLAHGIKTVLSIDSSESTAISDRCRNKGLELCHPQTQVSTYVSICERLLSNKNKRIISQGQPNA